MSIISTTVMPPLENTLHSEMGATHISIHKHHVAGSSLATTSGHGHTLTLDKNVFERLTVNKTCRKFDVMFLKRYIILVAAYDLYSIICFIVNEHLADI